MRATRKLNSTMGAHLSARCRYIGLPLGNLLFPYLIWRWQHNRSADAADHALDGILMIDPAGRLSFITRAAETLFGYRAAEVIGKDLHDTSAADSPIEPYRHAMAKFQKTGEGPVVGQIPEVNCRCSNPPP